LPPPIKAPKPQPPAPAVAVPRRAPEPGRSPAAPGRSPAAARSAAPTTLDAARAQFLYGNGAVAAFLDRVPPGLPTRVALARAVAPGGIPTGPPPSAPGGVPTGPVPVEPGPATLRAAAPEAATARQPAAGVGPAMRPDRATGRGEPATGRRTPGRDPKFQALEADVATKKRAVGSSHPPARVEAHAAQAAAVPPADDREARGKIAHTEDMNAAQPREFDKAAFIRAVGEAIARKAPKNLDEADKFGESGKAEEAKQEIQGQVGEGKDASASEIAATTAQPPAPAPDAKTVVPLSPDRVPVGPAAPNPANAAPDALPPSATEMSSGPEQLDRQMADVQVTEPQLARSNEPAFTKALGEKNTVERHSAAAPGRMRADEATEIKEVKTTAGQQGRAVMADMHGTRTRTGQQVGTGKTGAKGRDEQKRAQVTAILQRVFDRTKADVEKTLSDLDGKVDRQFTDEEKSARERFTAEHEDGMRRYKDERYSGWDGKLRWVRDLFADLPEEASRIYERAKDNYLAAMRQVIVRIADTVEVQLRRAKDRIAAGRAELTAAVEKLPADLRAIGREAATEFDDRFAELKDTVNEKGTELVDTLATRYTDAVKAVDEEIAREKEKNKGLVSKAADAIGGVLKAIIELKNLLLGVLRKAAAAIGAILKDPIGFLGKLISAVGGGLKLFMKNIGRHMQAGVLQWLLGTTSSAGLQLPAKFDARGIFMLLATLLGLSWANIRGRITRKVPEEAVRTAETGVPLVAAVKKQGVGGMWADLQSRVGDLKKELISKVIAYLTPTIIIAGITWILSLLNPASAFIRACKMIIDIVRFIVTQGRQIIEFVNSVLDAVLAIARGGQGGVPALVGRALARSIPVLIGALAAILGIGGIAGKVKQIFQTLAKPVNRAVDWVIDKIVGLVKKLWARLKAAFDRRRKKRAWRKEHRRKLRPDRRRLPWPRRRRDRRPDKDKPRPKDRAGPEELSEERFPYKIGPAQERVKVARIAVIDRIHGLRVPMQGNDPVTGFVINMPATPSDVKSNPRMAVRYLDDAWGGASGENVAAARTAVVIGVNTFEHLDPAQDADARQEVAQVLPRIKRRAEQLMAAFGFVWTPKWRHKTKNRDAPMFEVRRAYQRLTGAEKRQAVASNERAWRDEHKLPYGIFREEVLLSPYTQRAVEILSKVNQQVYVVSQDPDTEVTAPSGQGFLKAYDEILRDVDNDPILVIGGYHFEGFDWGPLAKSRTAQLTLLANRLDRAMRAAIGRAYPQLLYPTEQSMLIKVWERDPSRQIRLVFQDAQALAMLRASQGGIWGVGRDEGRHMGEWLKERYGISVAYRPEAGVSTSALPEDPRRGYTMTPEHVHEFAAGHERFRDLRPNPVYAALMQSQSVVGAFKLASAFAQSHPIDQATRTRLREVVFSHVEEAAKAMAANPSLTVNSRQIRRLLNRLDRGVLRTLKRSPSENREAQEAVRMAGRVAHEMITSMTADELRGLWVQLHRLLRDIMRDLPPSKGGPQ
jgi:hypothetical protein